MKTKLPRPYLSSAQYQGKYASPAFKLMETPASLHQNVFRALNKYGLSPQDFRVEDAGSGNVNAVYDLPARNTVVRVRLHMLDVTCLNLALMTAEEAYQALSDCWDALKKTDESIAPMQHNITTASEFKLAQEAYIKTLEPFLNVPSTLDSRTEAGVVFYLPGGSRKGDQGGYILLDRLGWNSGVLNLKVGMVIDAKEVLLPALRSYVDEHLTSILLKLGLEMEKAET